MRVHDRGAFNKTATFLLFVGVLGILFRFGLVLDCWNKVSLFLSLEIEDGKNMVQWKARVLRFLLCATDANQ